MLWVVLIATSALCFAIKLVGHSVPDRWLANAGASLGESVGEGRVDEASHPTVGG